MKAIAVPLVLTAGDNYPPAVATVTGLDFDPAGATASFELLDPADQGGEPVLAGLATATPGGASPAWSLALSYTWEETDELAAGFYLGRFRVLAGGQALTVPAAPFHVQIRG